MNKKITAILLVVCMLFTMFPTASFAVASSDETVRIPLANKDAVYALANIVNGEADEYDENGNYVKSDEFAYAVFDGYYPSDVDTYAEKRTYLRTAKYQITKDMTLSSEDGFMGIGKDENNSFAGSIDGNDCIITFDIDSNDYAAGTKRDYFGLVAYVVKDDNGDIPVIEDINFTGSIKSEECIARAAAVGYAKGTKLSDITSNISLTVENIAIGTVIAGIVAYADTDTKMDNIHSASTIKGVSYNTKASINGGGISGYMADGTSLTNATVDCDIDLTDNGGYAIGIGLVNGRGIRGTTMHFENIVATGSTKAVSHGNDGWIYAGALGGNPGGVNAKNIVFHDYTLDVEHNGSQCRVGLLLGGPHYTSVLLEDVLLQDCELIINGEMGNYAHFGGMIGYNYARSNQTGECFLTMKNVVSNHVMRTDGDIGTDFRIAAFVQYTGMDDNSQNNLFSANKAGVLNATSDDERHNNGVAGFYANERVAVETNGNAVIATNSSAHEDSKLVNLDIKWGVRNGENIIPGLPNGMSISYDEATGQIATLTTNNAVAGSYDLVAYVERTVNNVAYTLEMADVTVIVSGASPTVTGVTVKDGENVVGDTIIMQALSEEKTLTAAVATEGDVADTAGVVWKFYANSADSKNPPVYDKEVATGIMGQYVSLTTGANMLKINPNLSITSDYTFKVKAVSVTDNSIYDEFMVTITKPTVKEVTFTPDADTEGAGTETDPYVVYVGNTLTGQGAVVMNDNNPHANQKYTVSEISVLVGKDATPNHHLKSSTIARDNTVTFTAQHEGKVKVTLKSSTDTSITKDIYVLIKAPVTELTVVSSVTDDTVYMSSGDIGNEIGTLEATVSVSNATLKEKGNGDSILDASAYREVSTVTFTSSDELIATVDTDGKITATGFGFATITVTTDGLDKDGEKLAKLYDLHIHDIESNLANQEAPTGLVGESTTYCDTEDGKITGLDTSKNYEYRLNTGNNFVKVAAGSSEITGLKAGTYYVRFAADSNYNASDKLNVTIEAGPKHTQDAPAGLTTQNASTDEIMDGAIYGVNKAMEYTSAFGSVYHPINDDKIENLAAGTYRVRYAETETKFASADTRVTVGVKPVVTPEDDEETTPPSNTTSSGSGGFSGSYNYPVTAGDVDGAKVTFSDNNAVAGETVTITVTPDSGKQVDEVIVTDADGDVIPVTKVGDNQYSFTMPAGKVNVAVTTKAISYNNKIVLQIGNQNIVVDGKAFSNDVAPVIQGDRTLVPIRVIVEALGGTADWDEATRTVTLTIDGKVLKLVIDEMIPGFGQGAIIMDSRTYVPIRYVAEYIGAYVEWIEATQQIVILK